MGGFILPVQDLGLVSEGSQCLGGFVLAALELADVQVQLSLAIEL